MTMSCPCARLTHPSTPPPPTRQDQLSAQLAQLSSLESLPPAAAAGHFPSPPPGRRLNAARQAHALALADARVGSRWWAALAKLPRAAAGGGGGGDLYAGDGGGEAAAWAQQDAAWRRNWERIRKEEAAIPRGFEGADVEGPQQRRRRVEIEYSLEA